MIKKLTCFFFLSISIFQGCALNQGNNSDNSSAQYPICKKLSWSQVKAEFASNSDIAWEDLDYPC